MQTARCQHRNIKLRRLANPTTDGATRKRERQAVPSCKLLLTQPQRSNRRVGRRTETYLYASTVMGGLTDPCFRGYTYYTMTTEDINNRNTIKSCGVAGGCRLRVTHCGPQGCRWLDGVFNLPNLFPESVPFMSFCNLLRTLHDLVRIGGSSFLLFPRFDPVIRN